MTPDRRYGIVENMSPKPPKVPLPTDLKSAAQAAVDVAQAAVDTATAVASGAIRIPPASAHLVAELPDLVENLATATERLNTTMDRVDRYLALATPMLRTMDRLLPRLEALVATGDEVYQALSNLPGVATLTRFAAGRPPEGRSSDKRKK